MTKDDFETYLKEEAEIGEGWYNLVRDLNVVLSVIDPDYKIVQMKEKFGGLRFYVDSNIERKLWNIITEYESKSFTICEICGDVGKPRNSGWVKTLCDKHNEEREAKWNK
jgi:hypothetical protein